MDDILTDDPALMNAITTEVERLHDVFEKWFGNELENLDRVEAALGDTFSIVMPDGGIVAREQLMTGLNNSRDSRHVRIKIRNVQMQWRHRDAVVATYEEWQEQAEFVTGRLSTVVFKLDGRAPNGLRWEHVHETWLQPPPAS